LQQRLNSHCKSPKIIPTSFGLTMSKFNRSQKTLSGVG
jgi:hypothetical protein